MEYNRIVSRLTMRTLIFTHHIFDIVSLDTQEADSLFIQYAFGSNTLREINQVNGKLQNSSISIPELALYICKMYEKGVKEQRKNTTLQATTYIKLLSSLADQDKEAFKASEQSKRICGILKGMLCDRSIESSAVIRTLLPFMLGYSSKDVSLKLLNDITQICVAYCNPKVI